MKTGLLAGALGAFLFLVVTNVPEAYAQAMAPGARAVNVLAALVGKDLSANKYTATAEAGQTAVQLANNGAKVCWGDNGNWCAGVNLNFNVLEFPGGLMVGAGQNVIFDSWYPRQTGLPLVIQGSKGFRSAPTTSVGTCGASDALVGTQVELAATATSDARTCKCVQLLNGGAYRWENLHTLARGSTASDCPEST